MIEKKTKLKWDDWVTICLVCFVVFTPLFGWIIGMTAHPDALGLILDYLSEPIRRISNLF